VVVAGTENIDGRVMLTVKKNVFTDNN